MAEAASSNSGFVNVNGRAMAVPVWDIVELAQHIQMVYLIMVWGNPVEGEHKMLPVSLCNRFIIIIKGTYNSMNQAIFAVIHGIISKLKCITVN